MVNLQIQDITDLYVFVDDLVEIERSFGRPSILSNSEMLTILLWCSYFLKMKYLKNIYKFVCKYHQKEFPSLPNYANFVCHSQRIIPTMLKILAKSLDYSAPIRIADSTMLPVGKLIRANHHKVAREVADFGKNWQGWHFGFKLHTSINLEGKLCGIHFTPASFHDAQLLPNLVKGKTKIIVGDTSYNARIMREKLWKEKRVFVLAPPHPKQNKKLLTDWQLKLLRARPKVESVFDLLKEHFHLVTSFPRSIFGYFSHYLRILLAYQLSFLLS